jgi:hypothetical protein
MGPKQRRVRRVTGYVAGYCADRRGRVSREMAIRCGAAHALASLC